MDGLKHEIAVVRKSLFDKELLNNNYKEIEQLEDDDNPGFLEEVFDSFWSNSTQLLASIEEDMYKAPPDYISMDKNLHQLKGSSASVGANKIRITVDIIRECLKEENLEIAKGSLRTLKMEHTTLKFKLDDYFQLLKQLGAAGH